MNPALSNARLAGWLVYVGIFSALAYAGRFAVEEEDRVEEPLYRIETAVLGAVQFSIMIGIVLLICMRAPKAELLALRRPRSWPGALGVSVGVLVAVFVLGAVIGQVLDLDPSEEQGLLPDVWDPDRAVALALNAAVVVIGAPIVEELTFRGIGFTLLLRFGRWVAIFGTALAFGFAHGLVEAFPLLFAFAVGLAILRDRSDSVYPCILLHGVFNSLALGFALLAADPG